VCLFGDIIENVVHVNSLGEIVREEWLKSADIRREIELDEFVVMPNHVHGILVIRDVGEHGRPPLPNDPRDGIGAHGRPPLPYAPQPRAPQPIGRIPRSLGSFVAGFKSAVTVRINQSRAMPGVPVWQRNYYEHIIRDDESLNRIRKYIVENPLRWALDDENPARVDAGRGGRPAAPTTKPPS
jgi:REP element-mobilizing transposase RayT